jgi:hypothetical protein
VALLKLVGFRPIIVHGGGKEITRWINKVGLETRFVNGLRVTDKPTMEVAEMVLNKINKGLVSMMEKTGLKAVGISGKDGTILKVDKKTAGGEDIGFVGEVKEVNTTLLNTLLDNDFIPVCNGTEYNYYVKNDLNISKYSFDDVKNRIKRQANNQYVTLKFDSYEQMLLAEDDLFIQGKIYFWAEGGLCVSSGASPQSYFYYLDTAYYLGNALYTGGGYDYCVY